MRKRIITGLRTLLTAARVTLYTRQARAAKPKFSLEPSSAPKGSDRIIGFDDWMFEGKTGVARETAALSTQMNALAESMAGLEETLSLIAGETAFPVEALTQRPCAATLHHDADLFEGEAEARPPHQDNTIGGEGVFLFGDEPAFEDHAAQQAA